jgi:hypothetical protein
MPVFRNSRRLIRIVLTLPQVFKGESTNRSRKSRKSYNSLMAWILREGLAAIHLSFEDHLASERALPLIPKSPNLQQA